MKIAHLKSTVYIICFSQMVEELLETEWCYPIALPLDSLLFKHSSV